MRIAVKYCGGCNTVLERGELVARLAQMIQRQQPDWQLVPLNAGQYDVVVVVNGCAVGCAGKKFDPATEPVLIVAGESLQHKQVPEQELPAAVYQQLLQYAREKTD